MIHLHCRKAEIGVAVARVDRSANGASGRVAEYKQVAVQATN